MFTDIEGFTALMQQNEEKAMQFRNRHRDDFEKLTHKFEGLGFAIPVQVALEEFRQYLPLR